MAVDRLDVYLRADRVGSIEWDRSSRVGTFTYDEEHRARRDPTPLSVSLPLAARRHRNAAVGAYLWGLLPDNDAVLARWSRQFQVSLATPMGLLGSVGRDLPGAVSIVETDEGLAVREDRIEWLTEADVAAHLAEVRRDHTAWLGPGGRWSLAGAQAKIALVERDGRWGRPCGTLTTNRILKPAIAGLAGHDINEHLCLAAARNAGLRAVRSRVMPFGSERAIVVDRFDRRLTPNGRDMRFHQEDMCQALGVHPAAKYQSDGGPSAIDVIGVLRDHVDGQNVRHDIDLFVDALIYSWLIAAPDGHAKNYSILLNGGGVRLAPLYDIASALPYDDFYEPKIKVAMKVGGYYKLGAIRASAWSRFAIDARIDPDRLIERARELADVVPAAFADAARALGPQGPPIASLLVDRVAKRAADCRGCI